MDNEKLNEEDKKIEALVKEMKREYNRNYYKKNKEKIQENQKKYWINKARERIK